MLDGAFMVLGALIASAAGVVGPVALQARADRAQDRQERRQAQGEARIMLADFVVPGTQMTLLARNRVLRPVAAPDDVAFPRLVAEHLDGDTTGRVKATMANIVAFDEYVDELLKDGRRQLNDVEACFVIGDVRAAGSVTKLVGIKLSQQPTAPPPAVAEPDCGGAVRPYGIPLVVRE